MIFNNYRRQFVYYDMFPLSHRILYLYLVTLRIHAQWRQRMHAQTDLTRHGIDEIIKYAPRVI